MRKNPFCDWMVQIIFKGERKYDVWQDAAGEAAEQQAQWARDKYLQNKKYPDQLKHDTVIGLKVRSKSEAMIVRELVECKIPFHYEEELEIEGVRLYPDFTLRHPQTGERIYWEHFGRLDDGRYQKILCQKLQLYMQGGILPSDRLIITWETRENPLTLSEIHYKIQK